MSGSVGTKLDEIRGDLQKIIVKTNRIPDLPAHCNNSEKDSWVPSIHRKHQLKPIDGVKLRTRKKYYFRFVGIYKSFFTDEKRHQKNHS